MKKTTDPEKKTTKGPKPGPEGFGARLVELRRALGANRHATSQAAFARELDVKQRTYHSWESDGRWPGTPTLAAALRQLGSVQEKELNVPGIVAWLQTGEGTLGGAVGLPAATATLKSAAGIPSATLRAILTDVKDGNVSVEQAVKLMAGLVGRSSH